jgi:hypothetical protein
MAIGVQTSIGIRGHRVSDIAPGVALHATFTRHSLKDVEAILHAHYFGRDVALPRWRSSSSKPEPRTKL